MGTSTTHNITADYLLRAGKRPLHAGDDYDYGMQVKRAGSWLDLTSATLWLTIKESPSDPDSEAKLQYCSSHIDEIEIVTPASGIFLLHFQAVDTEDLDGQWDYDIKAKLANGKFLRIAWGKIEFLPNVTRTRTPLV